MNRLFALLLVPLTACATGNSPSDYRQEPVPDEEARVQALREGEAERRLFENNLVKLDQAMESYAQALAFQGVQRADTQAEQLERLIRETVLDDGTSRTSGVAFGNAAGNNFTKLQAAATDGSRPYHQGIALAALGFSGRLEVMPSILQGAQLDDPLMIDRAVFGLAILRAPRTPPGVLATIVENARLPEASRAQAAWALYRLQPVSQHTEEIIATWCRYAATDQDFIPTLAMVQAIRGLGLTRDDEHADLVAPYLKSPYPLIRMAAADALARMNSQRHANDLIKLLGPAETTANVRLHARKALQELAGQVDYGYDEDAWRKAFERK